MFSVLRIAQLNVRGLQDSERYKNKCKIINKLLTIHKIDILLIQDIVGNIRNEIINEYYYNQNNDKIKLKPNSNDF